MPYIGTPAFKVCDYCTRMYNGDRCPACGNPTYRPFKETTHEERERWGAKKYYADERYEQLSPPEKQ